MTTQDTISDTAYFFVNVEGKQPKIAKAKETSPVLIPKTISPPQISPVSMENTVLEPLTLVTTTDTQPVPEPLISQIYENPPKSQRLYHILASLAIILMFCGGSFWILRRRGVL